MIFSSWLFLVAMSCSTSVIVRLLGKSSNSVQPEISGNSGVAMANVGRRNRRVGTCERAAMNAAAPSARRLQSPSTGGAAFPPLT
jgi:hypothetical protein